MAYDKKGNPRTKSAAPLGKQHIKALEGILSKKAIESITTPGESRAANLQEIHKALSGLDKANPTPVIEDSPKVEEVTPAPEPSKVETVEPKISLHLY